MNIGYHFPFINPMYRNFMTIGYHFPFTIHMYRNSMTIGYHFPFTIHMYRNFMTIGYHFPFTILIHTSSYLPRHSMWKILSIFVSIGLSFSEICQSEATWNLLWNNIKIITKIYQK